MNAVFMAIVKLLLIVSLGFCLYRKNFLKQEALIFLTKFVVNIAVPCLIFSNIVTNFKPGAQPGVLIFVLLSILIFALGLILGILFSRNSPGRLKREFISLISFQNAGYLPMNIAFFLLPGQIKDVFLTYIFLYLLGFNILMWSIASFLIFNKQKDQFKPNSLLTPPIISIIASLIVVFLRVGDSIPHLIIAPLKMIGETSFVLSMIILGAWLAKSSFKHNQQKLLMVKICSLKLIILPFLVLAAVIKLNIPPLLGLFIIMEAAMPSAASLPIVANLHGANSEFISQGVLFTHIVSIVTVPLWIEIFFQLSNLSF